MITLRFTDKTSTPLTLILSNLLKGSQCINQAVRLWYYKGEVV